MVPYVLRIPLEQEPEQELLQEIHMHKTRTTTPAVLPPTFSWLLPHPPFALRSAH